MHYRVAGVSSVIIYFGEVISEDISEKVLSYYDSLKNIQTGGIIEIIPSYCSLYIEFDLLMHTHESIFKLAKAIDINDRKSITSSIDIVIPVYYGTEAGLDLEMIASFCKISVADVIKLHTHRSYRVYTVGFAPGFAYMGNVDEKISLPRLATPRSKVPQGSVAIANEQCAVYPKESPGGWNILGRTYIKMFDMSIKGFSYLKPGDTVKFVSIAKDEYLRHGGKL